MRVLLSFSIDIHFHQGKIMLYKSFLCLAAFAASLVQSAPLNLHGRQASNDVPDYVLKYGKVFIPLSYLYFLNNIVYQYDIVKNTPPNVYNP